MGYQLGIDIGGTFTDLFVYDEDEETIVQEKVSTTPEDFSRGFVDAIRNAMSNHDISPEEITHLSHGTTIATNAMIERNGVTTGLITTKGFRDITAIGREDRANIYDLSPPKTSTFTERKHRIGVTERVDESGEIITELDEAEVQSSTDQLTKNGVESVAVSLLHSYRNDDHENRIGDLLREQTDVSVSLSSEVMPEIREYERTLSTVINAYVGPIVDEYLESLKAKLSAVGIEVTLHIMQANGGVITPNNLDGRHLRLINSGPAAGVIGAKRFARNAGIETFITLDMGGTSADACVVRGGEIETTTHGELDGMPLLFPQVDIRAVGSGGGSIAWLDPMDILKVGPESSGADPGPACYGQGGDRPTVTDAALLLGYLNPDYFLGGDMPLDETAARDAVETLKKELGESTVDLANGILDIAATNMTQAIRLVTVEKGYDPRDFVLTCYGGAGPLFATRLARKLDIERTLVPPAPGVLSASGLLSADKKFSFSRSNILPFTSESAETIRDIYDALESSASDIMTKDTEIVRSVDMRYSGQTSKLTVDIPDGSLTSKRIETVRNEFHSKYEKIYGHSHPDEAIEGITWRLTARRPTDPIQNPAILDAESLSDAIKGTREAYTGDEFQQFTVYDRYDLPSGSSFEGPAIIEEPESTTIVEDECRVYMDESGCLLIDINNDW